LKSILEKKDLEKKELKK